MNLPSRERKFLFAHFMTVLFNWISFASGIRELRRDALSMLETHHDEFFDLSSRSYSRVPPRSYSRASPHTFSRVLSRFSHGPNHCSYGFGSRENRFEPRRFGYGPRTRCGDHFPRKPGVPAGRSYTHFEPRYLDDPYFLHRGSRPTRSSGEVQRIVKTSFSHMVKC
jgi:hypothetical protein